MPLSVLQFAAAMPNWGGAEMHLLNLSEQLQRRGHEVTVACQPGHFVEERARQMGIATVPLTMTRLHDKRDLGRMYRFLREKKIDVLHAHAPNDFVLPPLAAIGAGVPVRIMTRHLPHPLRNRRGAWVYGNIFFSQVVAVSESVRQTLIGSGMSPGRVETIHHGTDVEAFARTTRDRADCRAEFGLSDDTVAVGVVGRIAVEKGHHYLLEAAKILEDRLPVRFVIVGDGPNEDAIKSLTNEMGLRDRVIFAGFRDDINDVINALDIVATTSIWAEPCSAVVQQGMALRRPVIGTRAGGTPEMIVEDETGLLVPVADAAALAGAIARLAGDAGLRRRMGAAGRSRVEAHFSLSVMTDKVEALYRREYAKARGPQALQEVPAA